MIEDDLYEEIVTAADRLRDMALNNGEDAEGLQDEVYSLEDKVRELENMITELEGRLEYADDKIYNLERELQQ